MNKNILMGLILASGMLTSCAGMPSSQELAAADYGSEPDALTSIQKAKSHISSSLIDPYSAIIKCGPPLKGVMDKTFKNNYGYLLTCKVNAKNRFGGYTGVQDHYYWIHNDNMEAVEAPFEFRRVK